MCGFMNIVYDTEKLLSLLKDFHLVTKVRVGVYDCNYREILAWPERHSGFCKIIRSDERCLERCFESDIKAFKHADAIKDVYIYQCHAGLTEAVAPIRSDEKTIGYMMFGQMRNEADGGKQWERLSDYFASMNIDAGYLEPAFFKLQCAGKEKIEAYSRILQACALSAWVSGYIWMKRGELPEKLDSFISLHLDSDLSLDNISKRLGVGKTTLCNCAKEYFGMSVGKLIRKKRMEKAKELLKQTALPVSTIAEQVGINDYNYFTKLFRSYTGKTPTDYRKRYSGQGHAG